MPLSRDRRNIIATFGAVVLTVSSLVASPAARPSPKNPDARRVCRLEVWIEGRLEELQTKLVSLEGPSDAVEGTASSLRLCDLVDRAPVGRILRRLEWRTERHLRALEARVQMLEGGTDDSGSGRGRPRIARPSAPIPKTDAAIFRAAKRLERKFRRRARSLEQRVTALESVSEWSGTAGTAGVTCPAGATVVDVGDSVQRAINLSARGASLCIRAGVHRLTAPLQPRDGQTLTFESGATLNGSRVVTNWTPEGSYWVSDGHTQDLSNPSFSSVLQCPEKPGACVYEDLFMDGVPLTHVLSLSELGPGEVYFDKAADRMYIAQDPTGHTLEATVVTYGITSDADDVTLRGATIEKVGWMGLRVAGDRWTVERNEIRYAHVTGLRILGDDHTVRANYIHHNGNTGVVATDGARLLFEGNEIAYNNYLHFGSKPVPHHEGGVKVLNTSGMIVRGNYSHHNDGDGWWFDTDNIDVLVEGNVLADNTRYGLFYEVSWDARITDNDFLRNGTGEGWQGSGVRISTSANVEIAHNRFEDNRYSTLFATWQDRGGGRYGTFEVTNLHVLDNVFIMREGWVGSPRGNEAIASAEANNRFEGNDYIVPDEDASWWTWPPGEFRDWDEWGALGFDETGTLEEPWG
jgi:hypothetical protein